MTVMAILIQRKPLLIWRMLLRKTLPQDPTKVSIY
jgi:hypothetical protein